MATPEEEEALESDSLGEDNLFSKITTKINGLVFGEKVSAAASKTKSASHSRTKYSWYGTKLFTAKIAAKFTYNGSKVTAYRTENYIKRHFDGGIWSVYDKHSAIQKPSTKKRVAYQDGTASWGLSIKGVGLVFDETYIRVNVECNQNGKISKSSVLR
ncbi:hypothetical protein P5G51_018630 [Virgibacillus sp. 179-BFC.A HS]|uniref:Uncharacterized protein n=1 Tax=Tigheibacillus jepli TaxID=3035914 RepID=A0ABU5CNP8_9BACI|nr:hypothetical protein [Virgibacillus sp. 179-BFC.A HS]MDY0407078.1 hypothetical protein [Virgibacillus sp. 179-BFC.A HS]